MNSLALILLALVGVVAPKTINLEDEINVGNNANDYHTNIGIPLATEIRNAEAEGRRSTRIVGGEPALTGQFPYQVGIVIFLLSGDTSVCGGVLLNNNRVLTAAHCWWNREHQAELLTIVAGSLTIFTGGQRRNTSQVIMHGGWDPDRYVNNIAIAYLATNFTYTAGIVAPVVLPSGKDLDRNFAGLIGTVAGFGITSDNSTISDNQIMRYVNMYVISNLQCRQKYSKNLEQSHVCAEGGGNGGSPCLGDGGTPLTVTIDSRRILVGITSYGSSRGCQLGFPVVFTRINSYMKWIQRFL